MKIGEVAALSGCKVETIRYYEGQGLLPRPARTASGYRSYGTQDVDRLGFVTRCRALGFGLAEIRDFIGLEENPDLSCAEVDRLAREHLSEVRHKLEQLHRLERALDVLIAGCRGGQRADCAILRVLHRPEHTACSDPGCDAP